MAWENGTSRMKARKARRASQQSSLWKLHYT
jgi:hypothetical protein